MNRGGVATKGSGLVPTPSGGPPDGWGDSESRDLLQAAVTRSALLQVLVYRPEGRLVAVECLAHPFFEVRGEKMNAPLF